MSIVNGLFAGRSGISSHGSAIAVVGDNISNSSTIGFKSSRAEFEDIIAGGQSTGKTIGSGSSTSAVSTIFEQGTLEFTSRPLDLAIDGNGFFVVADGAQRYYTRAGNFKVDAAGYIVDQNNYAVLGFPDGGSGALEPLNIQAVSQDQTTILTRNVNIAGNLDASTPILAGGAAGIPAVPAPGSALTTTTYTDLSNASEFQTVVDVFDSLGAKHTLTTFFYHTGTNEWTARAYVDSGDVEAGGSPSGFPRQVGSVTMTFNGDGTINAASPDSFTVGFNWNNNSAAAGFDVTYQPFTQYAAASNILSITQDGQGVGAVTSVNIEQTGEIFALLDNGQATVIGSVGMVNFANPEGLSRVGKNLLQQSTASGEPIVGRASSGTFGSIVSGSLELSAVDIASEFVKVITLQRGFQASSRIITTIDQLLNEIIQLA